MLLGFSCKNFKTYREETIFSMSPNFRHRDLLDSILTITHGKKILKGLSTSVIYGPNASGKTNLIAAMDFFRCVVLSGNVQNIQNFGSSNFAITNPHLIPNWNANDEPVEFRIEFVDGSLLVEYALAISMGTFLLGNTNKRRAVHKEELKIFGKSVFSRTETNIEIHVEPIQKYLIEPSQKKVLLAIAQKNLQSSDLFLTNSFRHLFSSKISDLIVNWFRKSFRTLIGAHQVQTFPNAVAKGALLVPDDDFQNAIKEFGIHQNKIGFVADEKLPIPLKVTIYPSTEKENIPLPAELIESLGTLRFLDIFPILLDAFATGQTLVLDEFDASLHPMALKNIVNAFHNNEVNINQAQLIFNTHNPFFLDSKYFRRDEIKFVDRDEETGNSELYQLSDFPENGGHGARKTNSYVKNYFVHRYGAIHEVDFTPFLKKAALTGKENRDETN
ncbi:MAG: AAA family ATPase [Thermoguttaceae bacterium]|nr:AAA family ATPase [Thermoguttaceae bacterium]